MKFDILRPFRIEEPDRIYPVVKYRLVLLMTTFFTGCLVVWLIVFLLIPKNTGVIFAMMFLLLVPVFIIMLLIEMNGQKIDIETLVEFYNDHIIFRPSYTTFSKIKRGYDSLVGIHYFYRFQRSDPELNGKKSSMSKLKKVKYFVAVIDYGGYNVYLLPGQGFDRVYRHMKEAMGDAFSEKVIEEKEPVQNRYYELLEKYETEKRPSIIKRLWR